MRLTGAAIVAAALVASAATAHERPYPTSCEPEGVPLVARSSEATLFIQRTEGEAGTSLFGCLRATTEVFELGRRDPDEAYFAPPAVALAGSRAAFAVDTYDHDGDRVTYVVVRDLTEGGSERVTKAGKAYPRVGSVVVNDAGHAAWITCPSHGATGRGKQRPNCLRPGDRDRVYAMDAGSARPRVLDSGRGIHPRSLRRSGDRISWLRDGKRRSAVLRRSAIAESASQRCKPAGSSTVTVNDRVRVYRERPDPMVESDVGPMVACLRSNGRTAALDLPDVEYAYRPPGLRLNGPLVAVATAYNGEGLEDEPVPNAGVEVWDLRKLRHGRDMTAAIVNWSRADRSNANVRVGMIVLRSSGAIAWTTCPGSDEGEEIPHTPKPNCVAPGAHVKVWKLEAGRKRSKLLDRGTAIDPRSLSVRDGRVTWLDGGTRRSASLR